MPEDNIEILKAKLSRLRERERDSRAQASKIMREMEKMTRKQEVQFLCTLGRAVDAYAAVNSEFRADFHEFLETYLSRPTDIAILKNTQWELRETVQVPVPEWQPDQTDDDYHSRP